MKSYLLFIALASSMALGLASRAPHTEQVSAGQAEQGKVTQSGQRRPTPPASQGVQGGRLEGGRVSGRVHAPLRVFPAPVVGLRPVVGQHYLRAEQALPRSRGLDRVGGAAK